LIPKTGIKALWLIIVFKTILLQSQEGYPLYAEYLSDNLYVAHPSMAGDRLTGLRFKSSYRTQWLDQPEAPNIRLFTGEYSLSGRSKIAVQMFNDQNGYNLQQGLYLTYAHHISFQNVVWNTKRTFPTQNDKLKELYFGLSIGNLQNKFTTDAFDLSDNDPLIEVAQQKLSFFNIDAGFSFLTTRMFIHLTVKNLLESPYKLASSVSTQEVANMGFRRLLFSIGYIYYTKNDWAIEPSVLYQTFELSKEQIVDFNFKLYRYIRNMRLWTGISYRKDFHGLRTEVEDIGDKKTLQWLSPLFGLNYKKMMLSYNYATMTGQPRFSSSGIHQLTFGISF